MTAATAPRPEQVLRALFWKLLFRGRAALAPGQQEGQRRRRQVGVAGTLALYGLFGALPGAMAFVVPPLSFAASLHSFTLLFASLTLASAAGAMLFVREEAEILLHRPVLPEQMLRAKLAVLLSHSLLLAFALNAVGLVTAFWNQGNAPWFAAAHVVTTLLLMLLSASLVVLVYNVCLRWFGRERFDNLLTLVQTLLSVAMIAASQLLPRAMERMADVDLASGWAQALPPVWFGALDMVLCGVDVARHWPLALLAVAATALTAWLGLVRLGSAYGVGLMALNETAGTDERPERQAPRRLRRLIAAPPLRWWLRDPVERQAFLLTTAYLLRDRVTKLKIYPALAPLLVMPLILAAPASRNSRTAAAEAADAAGRGPSQFLSAMGIAYVVLLPLQALLFLRHSEHHRAAALFRCTPLAHWAPLFHGARKAALTWFALPALGSVTSIVAAMQGSATPFLLALPMLGLLPVVSLLPGLTNEWLPLSQPNEDIRSQSGCLLFAGAIMLSMAIGVVGGVAQGFGWFAPYIVAVLLGSALLHWRLRRRIGARSWRAAER
ncbi:MAG: hypothetical protein JNL08_04955 [Planctomycetes bacterium]|nr:hypothetical protein [Planctomycetota bacterium]